MAIYCGPRTVRCLTLCPPTPTPFTLTGSSPFFAIQDTGKVFDGKNHAYEHHTRQSNAAAWLADNADRFPDNAVYSCFWYSCVLRLR